MRKVQFKIDDLGIGITQAKGFLWSDKEGVHFEYQVSDNIIEVYKSNVNDAIIPYSQIANIEYKKAFFGGGKILIQLNSIKNVDRIPFIKDALIKIPLKRDQKENAAEFVVNANLDLANFNLEGLG